MGLVSGHLSGHDFNKIVDEKGILLSSIVHLAHMRLGHDLVGKSRENIPKLSPRQADIIKLLIEGKLYKEIGETLSISDNTVAFHIAEMKRKYGCSQTRELLPILIRFNLISF